MDIVADVASSVLTAVSSGVSSFLQDQDVAFSFWIEGAAEKFFEVTSFVAEEVIFGLPRIEIMLVSHKAHIKLEDLIDNAATLTIHHRHVTQLRHFSGIVVEAERGNAGHHRTSYRVTLLPSLYRLDNGSDCRIFQAKSVPDIVKTVLDEHGITDVSWDIGEEHEVREYLVCYNETHLAFIERILAEEGIFYYFRYGEKGKIELVLTDQPFSIPVCGGQSFLSYNATASGSIKTPYCFALNQRQLLRATQFSQRDYSFHNPNNGLAQTGALAPRGEKRDYELYRYPGRYKRDGVGSYVTQQRVQALRVDTNVISAQANTPLLLPGHEFSLIEHDDPDLNTKWRVLTIRHEGTQPQSWGEDAGVRAERRPVIAPPAIPGSEMSGAAFGIVRSKSAGLLETRFKHGFDLAALDNKEAQTATTYACAFTALESTQAYRPPQSCKPLVDGPQIALVVGPEGEQIHTDKHGRVKIHFPWDRHKDAQAEDSSCWIRVSQAWGGGSFGNIAVPRIGQEVIVDFLEGDPDQPIIMGRAYHANNHTPYQLPDHKTKMAIRSDSHKGDGGFNELSFEDEKGQENMFLHAEKDQTIKVKNNRSERIDANCLQAIGANQAVEVGKNLHEQIGGGMNVIVGELGSAAQDMFPIPMDSLIEKAKNLITAGAGLANAGGAFLPAGAAADGLSDFASHVGDGAALSNILKQAQNFDKERDDMNGVTRHTYRETGGANQARAGSGLAQVAADLAEPGTMQQFVKNNFVTVTGVGSTNIVGSTQVDVFGNNHHQFIGHTRHVDIHKDDFLTVGREKKVGVTSIYTMASAEKIVIKVLTAQGDSHQPAVYDDDSTAVTITLSDDGKLDIKAEDDIIITSKKKIKLIAEEIHLNSDKDSPTPPAGAATDPDASASAATSLAPVENPTVDEDSMCRVTPGGKTQIGTGKDGTILSFDLGSVKCDESWIDKNLIGSSSLGDEPLIEDDDVSLRFKAGHVQAGANGNVEISREKAALNLGASARASAAELVGNAKGDNISGNLLAQVGVAEVDAKLNTEINREGVTLDTGVGAGAYLTKATVGGEIKGSDIYGVEPFGSCQLSGGYGVGVNAGVNAEATRKRIGGGFDVGAAWGLAGRVKCFYGLRLGGGDE